MGIVLHPLEELDLLFALDQTDVGLLPVRPAADEPPLAAHLAVHPRDAHLGDLDLELGLDGALHLDLVGVSVHLEGDDVLVVAQHRRLLGDQRTPDDFLGLHFASTSTSRWSAPSLTTRKDRSTTS